MNRKEKIAFCNEYIFPQVRWDLLDKQGMIEALKLVSNWRVDKPSNIEMKPEVKDGFLFMNGDPLGRIAPKAPRAAISENACYMEGRILARQERLYEGE